MGKLNFTCALTQTSLLATSLSRKRKLHRPLHSSLFTLHFSLLPFHHFIVSPLRLATLSRRSVLVRLYAMCYRTVEDACPYNADAKEVRRPRRPEKAKETGHTECRPLRSFSLLSSLFSLLSSLFPLPPPSSLFTLHSSLFTLHSSSSLFTF